MRPAGRSLPTPVVDYCIQVAESSSNIVVKFRNWVIYLSSSHDDLISV